MPPKPTYVTSDVHLGGVPAETEASFHRWLRHATSEAEEIVINGDLFDFWFEFRTGVPKGHDTTLALLAEAVAGGVPVTLFGGNHDWWGGSYLEDEVGVRFYREPQRLTLAGFRVLVAHGDGLGKGDLGYRMLSHVLRNPLVVGAFRLVPLDAGEWIAKRVSRTEHRHEINKGPNPDRVRLLSEWAREQLESDPDLDIVITGHTHRPEQIEVTPNRWILNSGDWVYRKTYAVLVPGRGPEILDWE